MDAAVSPELQAIPVSVREDLGLFAHATLHIQRVKLLQESSLQKRLGLTADQVAPLAAAHTEVEQISSQLQKLPPAERSEKLRTEFRPKAEEFARLVDAQLNADQERELFREVLRRQRGAIIFLLPGVPEELALTDAQRAMLFRTIEETRQSVDFDNLYNPLELARLVSRANAARKAAEQQLTPEQKQKFEALLAK